MEEDEVRTLEVEVKIQTVVIKAIEVEVISEVVVEDSIEEINLKNVLFVPRIMQPPNVLNGVI